MYRIIAYTRIYVSRLSCKSHETLVRKSHDILTNVAQFDFHSYNSHETSVRVSHDMHTNVALFYFSCQIVANCSRFLK